MNVFRPRIERAPIWDTILQWDPEHRSAAEAIVSSGYRRMTDAVGRGGGTALALAG